MSNLVEKLRGAIVVTSEGKGLRLSLSADDVEAAADRIEALERERDVALEICADLSSRHPMRWKFDMIDKAEAALSASQAEATRLKEALKPFAEAADTIDDYVGDHIEMWEHAASMQVTAADFRRARSVLGEQEP